MNWRSSSCPGAQCPSNGLMFHCWYPGHNFWWIYITPQSTLCKTSCFALSVAPTGSWVFILIWLIASRPAWSAKGTSCLYHQGKSSAGPIRAVHHSSGIALIVQDYFHRIRMDIITSALPWIHSPSGWGLMPYPHFTARGLLSSCMMIWLPIKASHTMSRWIIVPNVQAASCCSVRGQASSITTSPLAISRPTGK